MAMADLLKVEEIISVIFQIEYSWEVMTPEI